MSTNTEREALGAAWIATSARIGELISQLVDKMAIGTDEWQRYALLNEFLAFVPLWKASIRDWLAAIDANTVVNLDMVQEMRSLCDPWPDFLGRATESASTGDVSGANTNIYVDIGTQTGRYMIDTGTETCDLSERNPLSMQTPKDPSLPHSTSCHGDVHSPPASPQAPITPKDTAAATVIDIDGDIIMPDVRDVGDDGDANPSANTAQRHSTLEEMEGGRTDESSTRKRSGPRVDPEAPSKRRTRSPTVNTTAGDPPSARSASTSTLGLRSSQQPNQPVPSPELELPMRDIKPRINPSGSNAHAVDRDSSPESDDIPPDFYQPLPFMRCKKCLCRLDFEFGSTDEWDTCVFCTGEMENPPPRKHWCSRHNGHQGAMLPVAAFHGPRAINCLGCEAQVNYTRPAMYVCAMCKFIYPPGCIYWGEMENLCDWCARYRSWPDTHLSWCERHDGNRGALVPKYTFDLSNRRVCEPCVAAAKPKKPRAPSSTKPVTKTSSIFRTMKEMQEKLARRRAQKDKEKK